MLEPLANDMRLRDLASARFRFNVRHQWFGQSYGETLHEATVLHLWQMCKTTERYTEVKEYYGRPTNQCPARTRGADVGKLMSLLPSFGFGSRRSAKGESHEYPRQHPSKVNCRDWPSLRGSVHTGARRHEMNDSKRALRSGTPELASACPCRGCRAQRISSCIESRGVAALPSLLDRCRSLQENTRCRSL